MTLPIRKFKDKAKKGTVLTKGQIFFLKNGFALDSHLPNFNHALSSRYFDMPFKDLRHLAEAWKANRDQIMAMVPEPGEGKLKHWKNFDQLAGL